MKTLHGPILLICRFIVIIRVFFYLGNQFFIPYFFLNITIY